MKPTNVIVQNVTTNVLNVLLMKNVTAVLLTEFKLLNHLVLVQLVFMKTVLLNVLNVLTNVVLVPISQLVQLVVKRELIFQLVTVKMDSMKKEEPVENVLINV
jgi:hypothetical protein